MRPLALIALLAVAPGLAAAPVPPDFPAKNVPETFFGTVVDDPYRALENDKEPAVAAWMKAQADYARSTLDGLNGYDALRSRIAELDNAASARIGTVHRVRTGAVFFTRRGASDDVFKLYVRDSVGRESLLADPEEWRKETGQPHAISYFQPSPDGARVLVGISAAGNELASIYAIDSVTGKRIEGPIDRARYASPQWLPDGKSFVYTRNPKLPDGSPVSALFLNRRAYLHVLGTDPQDDVYLLGPEGPVNVSVLPTESPIVILTPGSSFAVAQVAHGVQRELVLYSAALETLGKPGTPWKKICDVPDQVTDFAVHGEDIYLMTHRDSPRYSIVRTNLAAPDIRKAAVTVPAGDRLIYNVAAAKDGLYFEKRDGALKKLMHMEWSAKESTEVRFPVEGAATIYDATTDADGVIVGVATWTRALELFDVTPEGSTINTGLQPLGPFDAPSDLVAEEVKVRSHDGALVPLSIIYKRGLKRDGSSPAMLTGYGSYGVTYDANFDPVRLAWLERGGVYAVANVRGSSAYGEDWYRAGYKATKPNTWKDFIACAEHLVAQGYTSRAKLGVLGGSAGGITVGRALTARPDLFASAVPVVGMLDMVRLHVMPIGPVNVVEFGSVQQEDGFRGLLEMSSYHHVHDGTKYPAVLLQHGVNDTRVNVGQSSKMAARLMAATTSGKPVLLDLDYESGHGQGMTKAQRQREIPDEYAFMLWQAGDAGMQPGGPLARTGR
jgi:prolyl oligopeptidase